jgi:hypothetical protein
MTLADSGPGSLRQALLDANASGGDTITFAVAGTINVNATGLGALPVITASVTIDATTAPGYAGSPVVELNGSAVPAGNGGLRFTSSGNTVKGLAINLFPAYGINLNSGANDVIQGNYIGTNLAGTLALGNAYSGIAVSGNNNLIGGTTAAQRNVISGNVNYGIVINSGATGNVVEGDYIGTNAAGSAALPNAWSGVGLFGANNTVGGTATGAGNLISGNSQRGVYLTGSGATNNLVEGNLIGTNVTGTAALGNSLTGVAIFGGASGYTIGGTTAAARNVLYGNSN